MVSLSSKFHVVADDIPTVRRLGRSYTRAWGNSRLDWGIAMTNTADKTKGDLLTEIEGDIARYRRYRKYSSTVQWVVLLLITIAGFFTTAAGGVGAGDMTNVWFSEPRWLTTWGLIAAIGSLIVQNANPAQMARDL